MRVWLGEDQAHYYVLSRFLVRRMLTAAGIPDKPAVRISLELKRDLVDHDLLSLPQADLDQRLFRIMEAKGYGADFVRQYQMVVRFFHVKAPLLVLICGTAGVCKSAIATQLAERLNFSHVIQTDIILDLIKAQGYAAEEPLDQRPIWERGLDGQELLSEYGRECAVLRQGLDGILEKCRKEGKAMILEGTHLDPGTFIADKGMQPFGAPPRPLPAGSEQRPLLVPIVLEMPRGDHMETIRDWPEACHELRGSAMFEGLRTLQDYLVQFEEKGSVNFEVRLDSVGDTIDSMHEFLLSCLARALDSNERQAGGGDTDP